jgi:uncharacterized repeat protein (TIGR01451 family)
MTRNHSFRRQYAHRTIAVTVLATPLIALAAQLSALPAAAAAHPGASATARPHPSPSATVSAKAPVAVGTTAHTLQLSIGVTDSRQRVQSGDLVTYAVEVHNIGKRNAPRLNIVQTLPAGLTFISASRHPARRADQLTWRLSLPAGHTSKFRVQGKVGKTPAQLLRLATIACATTGASTRPIVCAAHSDELPAGAVAAAQASQDASSGTATAPQDRYLGPAIAAVVLVIGTTGYFLIRRRRQAARR